METEDISMFAKWTSFYHFMWNRWFLWECLTKCRDSTYARYWMFIQSHCQFWVTATGGLTLHREIMRIILNQKPRTIFFQKILTAITWDRRALLTNHGHVVFLLNKPFCDKKWFFKFLVSCFRWAAAGWEWATRTLNCYNHEGFLIHREK